MNEKDQKIMNNLSLFPICNTQKFHTIDVQFNSRLVIIKYIYYLSMRFRSGIRKLNKISASEKTIWPVLVKTIWTEIVAQSNVGPRPKKIILVI